MPSAGQTITAAAANALSIPVAPAATGTNGTSTSATTDTRDAVLANYQFTAVAGVRYEATVDGMGLSCTVVADRFAVALRYTVGGATPTSASTLIGHTSTWVPTVTGSNGVVTLHHGATFIPGAGLITISVFVQRLNGTGIATPVGQRELYVEGIGFV